MRNRLRGHSAYHGPKAPELCRIQDGSDGITLLLCSSLRHNQRRHHYDRGSPKDDDGRHLQPRLGHLGRQCICSVLVERIGRPLGKIITSASSFSTLTLLPDRQDLGRSSNTLRRT